MTLPEKGTFSWPIPPYFQKASGSFETASDDCVVEMLDGRIIAAALEHFDPLESQIHLKPHTQGARQSIALDLVRTIRLTRPLDLVVDAAAVSHINGNETQVSDEGEFLVHFRDGKTFEGMTRGFVNSKSGLFLYLLEGDHQHAWRCFVPQQQLDNVRVGPLPGDELTRAHLVTDAEVATALQTRASQRQKKLGEQWMEHGIVTHDELKRALQSQRNHGATIKLGDLLLEAELVTSKQLTEALRLQALDPSRRLGDVLVDMGAITPWQMQIALSEKLGIPFVNLREFKLDPIVLELVSASFAKRHQVLPLLCMGESLVVAVENPLMMDFAQDLGFLTKKSILPVISNADDLRASITTEYANHARSAYAMDIAGQPVGTKTLRGTNSRMMDMEDLTRELGRDALQRDAAAGRSDEFDERVHDNVLVRLVNSIIIEAHSQNASDIHIESNAKTNTRVRFRKDGELEDYLELQPAYREALVSRIKVMAGLDVTEHRRAQDGKIDFSRFAALSVELRVAIVPTANNLEDAVLRILAGVEPLPLDQLGMCARDLETLGKMVSHTYGLILVCGPTGSGKTTTLHSLLHTINRPDIKIWTAEDPVEITQAGLRQVQINSRIGWTFASAMRAFLRADPDVIMVGEMRDAETAKIAIEASLTGHLVFSTLHTNTAAESVVRLIELGMDPFNFADALIGILSQRLVRKLCRECKKAHIATDTEILALAREHCMDSDLDPANTIESWKATYATDGHLLLYEPVGCSACRAGFRGRVGVYELMASSPLVKGVIRSRGTAPEVLDAAQRGGMRMLRQDAIEKVLSGAIDLASARAVWS